MLSLLIVGDGNVGPYERYFKGTLAAGFRPTQTIYLDTNWYDHDCKITIDTNGNIDFYQPFNNTFGFNGSSIEATLVYIIA